MVSAGQVRQHQDRPPDLLHPLAAVGLSPLRAAWDRLAARAAGFGEAASDRAARHLDLASFLEQPQVDIQRELHALFTAGEVANVLASVPPRSAAHLRAAAGRGAGAFLCAVPSFPALTLSSAEWPVAARSRLQVPLLPDGLPLKCAAVVNGGLCGAPLDAYGDHPDLCLGSSGARTQRSIAVELFVLRCCERAGLTNPMHRPAVGDAGLADVAAHGWGALCARTLVVEVAVCAC